MYYFIYSLSRNLLPRKAVSLTLFHRSSYITKKDGILICSLFQTDFHLFIKSFIHLLCVQSSLKSSDGAVKEFSTLKEIFELSLSGS